MNGLAQDDPPHYIHATAYGTADVDDLLADVGHFLEFPFLL